MVSSKKLINKILKEDNFLSLSGNVLIAVFGLGGFAILARSLTIDEFGQWVLFLAVGSFIEMFRFGISCNGLIRYLSGANNREAYELVGSNALIGLIASLLISTIIVVINFTFKEVIANSGFRLFFDYYPILVLVNLGWNNAVAFLQSRRHYAKILLLKATNSVLFFGVLVYGFWITPLTIDQLIIALIVVNGITSLISLIKTWDGFIHLSKFSIEKSKTLLDFGKYTTFTLIGTNLLRNADTFIISLSPLGPAAVALYSIPLKLTELQQIPLRSFAATAFPKMSKASVLNDIKKVRSIFYAYAGALTYLFVFASFLTFIFADELVLILSGQKYVGIDPVTGFNAADIVRVFSIYGLILPIDRMTGIALDSINKPNINALKVLVMVSTNIIGNLIAIFVFKSLILVAVSSIVFTMVGIMIGMYFLNKEMTISYRGIFKYGLKFYAMMWRQLRTTGSNYDINPVKNELR